MLGPCLLSTHSSGPSAHGPSAPDGYNDASRASFVPEENSSVRPSRPKQVLNFNSGFNSMSVEPGAIRRRISSPDVQPLVFGKSDTSRHPQSLAPVEVSLGLRYHFQGMTPLGQFNIFCRSLSHPGAGLSNMRGRQPERKDTAEIRGKRSMAQWLPKGGGFSPWGPCWAPAYAQSRRAEGG